MSSSLWQHALVLAPALAGFCLLALVMARHQEDLFNQTFPPARTAALRAAGWLSLLASLWLAVSAMGWSFGLVAFSGHTSAAAGLVFLSLLAWNRRRGR